jgi:15-cis-phytoene synthase
VNEAIAALVRRHDPDRFLTALFAPPEHRDALLTLYAFDHELARAQEVTSEPHLALIRLQWWREVVEGARRRHEVATPLAELLDAGRLTPEALLPVIDAYETDAEGGFETLADWRGWLLSGAGGIAVAAGQLLGAAERRLVWRG